MNPASPKSPVISNDSLSALRLTTNEARRNISVAQFAALHYNYPAMPVELAAANYNWLCTGREVFPAMLSAIEAARESICLETYIYSGDALGERFRGALVAARQRGVEVRVLFDALGSLGLSNSFWDPLRAVGADVLRFNPSLLNRFGIRDHRKMLVMDRRVAFVGGFNIASEYDGDGVNCGWCDLGLKIEGPLAAQLAASFEEMFARARSPQTPLLRLTQSGAKRTVVAPREQLLLSGPGRGRSPIKTALRRDLAHARDVRIMMAYFLPTWRMRRSIVRVTRTGGRVELILAGKSDVTLSQLAGQSLYRRFLKAGARIHEYQPQVLHAKLLIMDDIVYVGSANLDQRSLNINYELMIRLHSQTIATQAREIFQNTMKHCREITLEDWRKHRTLWRRIKQHLAYLVLVRIDPHIGRWKWRAFAD
jgi:cardiolipin synthase